MHSKMLRAFLKLAISGKRQVIRISRVRCSGRLRERAEPAVNPVEAEIGKSRRSRRPLRQMRPHIHPPRFAQSLDLGTRRDISPYTRGAAFVQIPPSKSATGSGYPNVRNTF